MESKIEVQFKQAVSALNQTTTALDGVVSLLKDTNSQLNNLKNNTGLEEVSRQAKELNKTSFKDAFKSTIKISAVVAGLRKGWNIISDITKANIDMIETTNLFEVSMGKVIDEYGNLDEAQSQYYTKAMDFQDKMNEKLGTNKKELMEFQAKFNSLYANQGVDKKTSEWLSEQLIKAGYDIASLRNQETSAVMDKLYSGITGQTKSIRDLGVDIGEGSITATLQRLGINKTVNQLSYAEKEIARYITIVEQASLAQGDFARTMGAPAQQIKIFKAQLAELKQVAGSFFTGLFGQIMPYVNGIIMAIKEVLKVLGSVFGFEIDTGDSSLGEVADVVEDIDSGIGSATKKAKEFKKQLMGFDEINNITPQNENNGGSGGGSVNGIDSALLNALKEWDNQMDSISGKAQEIRDKILDWLGITDGSYKNLKRIWEIAKAIGVAFATWKISNAITGLLEKLGVLSKIKSFKIALGITLAVTGLENWISGMNGGNLIQSILGALTTGGGIWLATGSSTIALPVTLVLSLISITKKIDDKIKLDEKFWKPLYEKFGFEYTGNDFSWANYKIRLQIGFEIIGDIINNLKEKFSGAWTKFITWLSEKWNDLKGWFSNLPYNLGKWIGETAEQIYVFFTQTIPNAWNDFWNWIGEKWNDFINWLTGLPSKIWEGLKNIGAKIVDFFTITLPKAWNDFINWIKELPAKFLQFGSDIIQGLINGIKQKWNDFWKVITDFVNNFVQGFKDALGIHSPSTIFQGFGINIMEGLINGISNMLGNLKSKIFEVSGNIQNWFNEKISNIKQIGSNIVSGIINGISSATSGLKKKVQGLAGNVSSWFKSALGIHSPSKVMADLAQYIPMGIAKGIDNNTSYAMKSAKNMAINVSDAVENNTKINPLAKFNNGIKVKTEDFAVDTNQNINYSAIKGQILAQSQINIDENIVDRIAEAVTQSMKNAELNINIEAKTEEGIIFKKVQNSAREYTMQTGKPAFSY